MYLHLESYHNENGEWRLTGEMETGPTTRISYDHEPTMDDLAKALTEILSKYQEAKIKDAQASSSIEQLSLGIGAADREAIDSGPDPILVRALQAQVPQARAGRAVRPVRVQEDRQEANVPTGLRATTANWAFAEIAPNTTGNITLTTA